MQLKPEETVVDSLTIGTFNFKQKNPFNKKKKKKVKIFRINTMLTFEPSQPAIICLKLAIERYEICSKLITKTPGVFIVIFEHISHLYSSVSTVNFKQVYAGWGKSILTF